MNFRWNLGCLARKLVAGMMLSCHAPKRLSEPIRVLAISLVERECLPVLEQPARFTLGAAWWERKGRLWQALIRTLVTPPRARGQRVLRTGVRRVRVAS